MVVGTALVANAERLKIIVSDALGNAARRLKLHFMAGLQPRPVVRTFGLIAVLLALAALSPASLLTLVLPPDAESAALSGGLLQSLSLTVTLAMILWLLRTNGRLAEELEDIRNGLPEAGTAAGEALSRQRELEATIAELKDWRNRLQKQASILAEAVDRATREKEAIERECQAKAERLIVAGHELRTPLNAVIGFSELMLTEVFGPLGHGKYQDYARHIRDSGTRLLETAHDILDLAARAPAAGAPHVTSMATTRILADASPSEPYARIAASLRQVAA